MVESRRKVNTDINPTPHPTYKSKQCEGDWAAQSGLGSKGNCPNAFHGLLVSLGDHTVNLLEMHCAKKFVTATLVSWGVWTIEFQHLIEQM